jgi:hypothetical protein
MVSRPIWLQYFQCWQWEVLTFSLIPSDDKSRATHVLPVSLIAPVGMSLAYIPVLVATVNHVIKDNQAWDQAF